MSVATTGATISYPAALKGAEGRPLYIWGAGNQGRGLCRVLERCGVPVAGFIDSSTTLQGTEAVGHRIFSPGEALTVTAPPEHKPFIVIATFFFEKQVGGECAKAGLAEGLDYVSYTSIKPFDWAVDVSGLCNLHCLSCPRARRDPRHPHEGFMKVETFEKVVDKILREDPLAGSLQLYQWGEPLLNPRIDEFITMVNNRGLLCALSSNLNEGRNLEKAVRAQPAWFRVSVSGWGKSYEHTHSGGHWERFYANFLRLADLRRRYAPSMKTEVYYHLYKHNKGEEATRVRELCKKAGFEFHPVYAYLISLDDVLDHLEGKPLPPEAAEAEALLDLTLDKGMALARAQAREECQTLRCIHVNWDLSVSSCMMFFNVEGNRVAENFLETPLEEIAKRRAAAALCRRCKKQALHRYCSVYSTEPTQAAGLE
jgi:MoaA/NifB/PqqE/SkfB family radical SAM enzyme